MKILLLKQFWCQILLLLLFLGSNSYADASARRATPTTLNRIVAKVDKDIITQHALEKKIALLKRQREFATTPPTTLRQQALESLIATLLQLQMAHRSGITVSEAEVDTIIANIAKNNNMTVAQFKKVLVEQEKISFAEYREQLQEQILLQRVAQQFLGRDLKVTDAEIEQFLRNPHPQLANNNTQYQLLDLVVTLPDIATPEQIAKAQKIATAIAAKLRAGTTVAHITEEYRNSDYQVMVNDLGWRKLTELPHLFIAPLTKMQPGTVSAPIKAPNGFHLLQLLAVEGGAQSSIKEQARELIYQQKLAARAQSWLQELRAKAYIKINK